MGKPTLDEDNLRRAQEIVARELNLDPLVRFLADLFKAQHELLDRYNGSVRALEETKNRQGSANVELEVAKNELIGLQERYEDLEAQLEVANKRNQRNEKLKADMYQRQNEMKEANSRLIKDMMGDRTELLWHINKAGELSVEVEALKTAKLQQEEQVILLQDELKEVKTAKEQLTREHQQLNCLVDTVIDIAYDLVLSHTEVAATAEGQAMSHTLSQPGDIGRLEKFFSGVLNAKNTATEIRMKAAKGIMLLHEVLGIGLAAK